MSQPPPITRSGAQYDARRELSKAIYHRTTESLPVRAVRAVGHWLNHALDKSLGNGPSGSLGALAVVVVLLAVVAVVIWRVGIPRRAAAFGTVLETGRSSTAADHRGLSEQAAARRDWHTAVIERMRAIARELESSGLLEPRPGRTATELAREAAAVLPQLTTELTNAADTFNAVAYGNRDATEQNLTLMIAADDGVRRSSRSEVLAR